MANQNETEVIVRLSRREALIGGLAGAAGLMLLPAAPALAGLDTAPAQSPAPAAPALASTPATKATAAKPAAAAPAKAVIQIWMWGGPAHTDTFDPKPDAGSDYCGAFTSPIKTNVDGIIINELLTGLATMADKYALIRSVCHDNYGHETAAYMVQTGNKGGDGIVHPGLGAVVSLRKGYDAGYSSLIPPYIVLTQLTGRFSEAGFLGPKAQAFATGGDPAQKRFVVEGVVAEGISDQRQRDRRALMDAMNTFGAALGDNPAVKLLGAGDDEAYGLILGSDGKVFDLTSEPDDLRARYGKTTFGQSCLAARRLVERGVPFITINNGGWDTHKENFQTMKRKLPEFDKGVSTLLADLSDRGLLDSTIVWCGGEFGRTPKVMWDAPWNGGRNHWGACFSHLLAGGGFKGGVVVGSSDARGEQVASRPVFPSDLIGSICERAGIPAGLNLPNPQGIAIPVTPAVWDPKREVGLLTEIMPA